MPPTARPCRVGPVAKPSAVTEALRRHVDRYQRRYGFDPERAHVLNRLLACRTAALGVHSCVCDACGWSGLAFNSCRDRHCPQCQGRAAAEWLQARQARMLPTPHFQVVFTLPAELRPVAFATQQLVYGLLFRTAASILQDLASQRFDARMGITAVLHTWTSELSYHPHVHCLVTAGGLNRDDERWVDSRQSMMDSRTLVRVMALLAQTVRALFRSRADLALENLALRQQVAVLKQQRPKPPLTAMDRAFGVALQQTWKHRANALVIVKPDTVVRWHRKGFKAGWLWRTLAGEPQAHGWPSGRRRPPLRAHRR